jgi:hypothetical protein
MTMRHVGRTAVTRVVTPAVTPAVTRAVTPVVTPVVTRVVTFALALAALASVAAGCAGDGQPVVISEVTPPYGLLIGGSRITITGAGFDASRASAPQVLIGGRSAPLVHVIRDDELEALTPPGLAVGPTEIAVIVGDRIARADDLFRYSTPPTLISASPRTLAPHSVFADRITVRGTGFVAEDAGPPVVLVDGLTVAAEVVDDTTLTFSAPPGRPFLEPDVVVINHRGRASLPRAFRHVPAETSGLLLFTGSQTFATFVDPDTDVVVDVPVGDEFLTLSSVVRDARGRYWGVDRFRQLGVVDLGRQHVDDPRFIGAGIPAMTRVGDDVIALDRDRRQLGRLDLDSALFTPLGDGSVVVPCCGNYGLAHDGTTLYLTAGSDEDTFAPVLYTVDVATGQLGPGRPLSRPGRIEDLRWFRGRLFTVGTDGSLLAIDPASGVTTLVRHVPSRARAIEVYE